MAKTSFRAWCEFAISPLGLKPARHHLLLIKELEDVARGATKRLMVCMPPGSAKSTYTSKLFSSWYLAQGPNLSIIAASHTSSLAEDFSREVQGYVRQHSETLGYSLISEPADLWKTNTGGRYRAAGVGGPITGSRADIAIIDDPVKSRSEADSPLYRERSWKWFTADLRTRMKPNAPIVLVMTRWHEDDLGGRILQTQANSWRVLSLPAVATAGDPLGRQVGDLLWQDDEAYDYAGELGRTLADYEMSGAMRDWNALYQQDPIPAEGSLFKIENLGYHQTTPPGITRTVRAWDLAATEQTGTRDPDWTVGVKMARLRNDSYVVLDVIRFRGPPELVEKTIMTTALADGRSVSIGLPQDPGQAGKQQVLHLTSRLSGHDVVSSAETGSKATRAAGYAAQVNVGNVYLVKDGGWNPVYREELAAFPSGRKDDQVDASSRAFEMVCGPSYDDTLDWVG